MLKPRIFENFKSDISDAAKFRCGVAALVALQLAIKISREVQAAVLSVFYSSRETRVLSLKRRVSSLEERVSSLERRVSSREMRIASCKRVLTYF